jgi:hypothetical protein
VNDNLRAIDDILRTVYPEWDLYVSDPRTGALFDAANDGDRLSALALIDLQQEYGVNQEGPTPWRD